METNIEPVITVELDDSGLLVDPRAWSEDVARAMALDLGIDALGEEHWKLIGALRAHYARHGVAPTMNSICRPYGKDWLWGHELFGSCLNAWRVAGLPDPGEEAKSYLSGM